MSARANFMAYCDSVPASTTALHKMSAVGSCHSRSTSAGSAVSPNSKFDTNSTGDSASRESGCLSPRLLGTSLSWDSIGLPPGLEDFSGDTEPFRVGVVCTQSDTFVAHDVPFSIPPPPARHAPVFHSVESLPPAGFAVVPNNGNWEATLSAIGSLAMPPPPVEWAPVIDDIDAALPPPPPALMPMIANSLQHPSAGSAKHASGTCRPCAFVHSKGCVSGIECLFCHLCTSDDKRKLKRDQKKKRREDTKLARN